MTDKPRRWKTTLAKEPQAALGRLTAEFGCLEASLRYKLTMMTLVDPRISHIVFGRLSVRDVIQSIRELAKQELSAPHREWTLTIVKAAQTACDKRNTLLHSLWSTTEDGTTIRADHRKMIAHETSVEDIHAVADRIADANGLLLSLMLYPNQEPSPEPPSPLSRKRHRYF